MSKLVSSDFSLNEIFDIFLSTIYEEHASLIDSYLDLNITVDDIVKKLTDIDFDMPDEFIYQVYENININEFFRGEDNSLSAEENSINNKNYELLHMKALKIRDNFETKSVDLSFSTNGQKLLFQNIIIILLIGLEVEGDKVK